MDGASIVLYLVVSRKGCQFLASLKSSDDPPGAGNGDTEAGTNVANNAARAGKQGIFPEIAMDTEEEPAAAATSYSLQQVNITPLLPGPSNMDSTTQLVHSMVNKKLDSGEISELSDPTQGAHCQTAKPIQL
eukprot:g9620.t1